METSPIRKKERPERIPERESFGEGDDRFRAGASFDLSLKRSG